MWFSDHLCETSPKLNFCSQKSGQVGAIRLGISRALQNWEPGLRPYLKAGKIGFHRNPFLYSSPSNLVMIAGTLNFPWSCFLATIHIKSNIEVNILL
jgi:hypothetical protein